MSCELAFVRPLPECMGSRVIGHFTAHLLVSESVQEMSRLCPPLLPTIATPLISMADQDGSRPEHAGKAVNHWLNELNLPLVLGGPPSILENHRKSR